MAAQIQVDPDVRRGHRTVASAVAAASPGDEINIAPGIYAEPIVLNRPVRLTATPGTVTIETGASFALRVLPTANGSTISGLHLQGQVEHVTVKVEAAATRFENCVLEGSKERALWVDGAGEVYLDGCRVSSALNEAVSMNGTLAAFRSCAIVAPSGVAMSVEAAQISLEGCSFIGIGSNVLWLKNEVHGVVRECTFQDCRNPDRPVIWVGEKSDVTVERCLFERLAAEGVFYGHGSRGTVEGCTFRSMLGNAALVAGGAVVAIRDLTAADVDKAVVKVETGGRVDVAGARADGKLASFLVVEKDSQADVTDADVTGCTNAVIAVIGGRLTLSRFVARGAYGNVLKVFQKSSCQATGVRIDCGEVDFPLVFVTEDASLSLVSSAIRGGAESAVYLAASTLELTEVTFDGVGGPALLANGGRASVNRCRVSASGMGIDASGGCRVAITGTEVEGGDHGVVSRGKAIVRVTDCVLRASRQSGVKVEDAKAVLTSTRVEDSQGDGVVVEEGGEIEFRDVEVRGSAGVGVRSATALELDGGAITFHDNAKGNLQWPGRSARSADRSLDELLAELDELVGLASVKKKVRGLLNIIRLRQREAELGRDSEPVTLHAVFTGPPGTGKTTVARLYGELLHAMGFLDAGRIYEVTRADLVVGFIGQTATNTRTKFTEAMGGVLFIDEAYSLAQEGGSHTDFGEEAINELVPLMENHRADIAVIVAGYTDEMVAFLDKNPGLRSRFAATIEFPSYTNEELMEILHRTLARQERSATPEALAVVADYFASLPRDRDFGNGREVRRLLAGVVEALANRVAESDDFSEEALSTVVEADVRHAIAELPR